MSFKVTRPDGTTKTYEDLNKAIAESPSGSVIVSTTTGMEYKVKK